MPLDVTINVRSDTREAFDEWWPHGGLRLLRPNRRGLRQAWEMLCAVLLTAIFFVLAVIGKSISAIALSCHRITSKGTQHQRQLDLAQRPPSAARKCIRYIVLWYHRNSSSKADRQRQLDLAQPPPDLRRVTVNLQAPSPSNNTSLLFGRLPVELRRRILIYVFGNKTLHMDLQLRKSVYSVLGEMNPLTRQPWWRAPVSWDHAGILKARVPSKSDSKLRWRWFSCVCHRYPAFGPNALSYGRRSNFPVRDFREPESDLCLKGGGCCNERPIHDTCLIGIMGWMLLCRQAYIEGVEVLYRFNTIHVASPILIRAFQDIMPPQVVSTITSLELVWDPLEVRLEDGFTGLPGSDQDRESFQRPLFPDLKHLRISFSRMYPPAPRLDYATGLETSEDSYYEYAEKLTEYTLPAVDQLLDRIAPLDAEVTFSCRNWSWYIAIETTLIETQGREATRVQTSELGGFKCWRPTPKTAAATVEKADGTTEDNDVEKGKVTERPRRDGFWIHVPSTEVRNRRQPIPE